MAILPFVILASSSPRRQQLLRQMGAEFTVVRPDIEEIAREGESPKELVERLAVEKALAIDPGRETGVVLGCDTVVVIGEDILGKPENPEDARRMLRHLSGRPHTVFTGFALVDLATGHRHVDHARTEVLFRQLSDDEIVRYVESGSALDKAGSYGIQDDFGAVFVEHITGDFYTVMGLPLTKVYLALQQMGRGDSGS